MQDGQALKSIITTNGTTTPAMTINGKEQPMSSNAGPSLLGATHYVSTVNGKTITTVMKKDGKVVATRKTSLSGDGKVLTAVTDGSTPTGQKLQWTVIFDKQ